ncbi:MAG: glycosyltransferase family 1 protein [Anaerolineae bacterium]|nr:glycosyltransferase family 1 protein [Anaerolineae bacterium]MCO5195681.1 glycosyltransferase family 1 protein [Anaerolineae bacterium]MCO5205743.1 glycosyltransferase family 1 protein [Anaerolineae bacterium]
MTLNSSKLRIIVSGLIAQYPLGGVTWDYLQYVLGLAQQGHDVYYIEDTGQWPYNPEDRGTGKGYEYNVRYLSGIMQKFGLEERWAYCFPWETQWFGMSDRQRRKVVESADLLINVSGVLRNPWDFRAVERLVYIDSDPVFTQVKLARGQQDFCKMIDTHDVLFSFGEALSELVPDTGYHWRPTRQPIVLNEWRTDSQYRDVFTTVMNWTSYKPVKFEGKTYGQKDLEFKRFLDLPQLVPNVKFELAVNEGKTRRTPRDLLKYKGWYIVDPEQVCPDFDSYRNYIQTSKAEWSIAKNGYVVGQPGWFSCRSACYLAAGRPVVVQDTGFSRVLPVGEGLFAFGTQEEAVTAIHSVNEDYGRHSKTARAIAEVYFDSNRVLTSLIARAME